MVTDEHDRWAADGLEVVRSEEELRATVEAVPYERVRLTKRVVIETVHIEVELQREELVVEHLPLVGGEQQDAQPQEPRTPAGRLRDSMLRLAARRQPPAVSAEEVTLELLEERYEVVKRVVPRERVRLSRELLRSQAPVDGEVRKEVVEVTRQDFDG